MGQLCCGKQPTHGAKVAPGETSPDDYMETATPGDPDGKGTEWVPQADGARVSRRSTPLTASQERLRAKLMASQKSGADKLDIEVNQLVKEVPDGTQSLVKLAEDALERVTAADNLVQGWDKLKPQKELQDCQVDVHSDPQVVTRVRCKIDASADDVLETIRAGEQSPEGTSQQVVQQITDELSVIWIELKLPIIKDRDFVICQLIKKCPECFQVVCVSVPPPTDCDYRPESKKYVRGAIIMQTTQITPIDTCTCQIKWLSCIDMGVWIPSVAKITARKGAEALVSLKNAAVKRRNESQDSNREASPAVMT